MVVASLPFWGLAIFLFALSSGGAGYVLFMKSPPQPKYTKAEIAVGCIIFYFISGASALIAMKIAGT